MKRVLNVVFQIVAATLTLMIVAAVPANSQERDRQENLVYSIIAFNGRDYSRTFAREESDSIYLIADVDNLLSVRKTLVYYWPITRRWRTDTETLDIALDGVLRVRGPGGRETELEMSRYSYYNARGTYQSRWVVAQGVEAQEVWDRYEASIAEYRNRLTRFQDEQAEYRSRMNQLTTAITRLRSEGEDVSELLDEIRALDPPEEPVFETDFVTPPTPVSEAFVVNLPVGEYELALVTPDGYVMEGSERRLVVFDSSRTGSVGMEVIPEDRWTRSVESSTPSSVFYVDGSADLYLRPYRQYEYNDLYYEKTLRNDARGNPNLRRWVRTGQLPQATIEVTRDSGETTTVAEAPYFVQQLEGRALGYRIVTYEPDGAHAGRPPSIVASRVPLSGSDRVVRVTVRDADGSPVEGGRRQIRVVRDGAGGVIPIAVALLPLPAMAIVLFRRSRVYTS